jgi:hypothetical protein
MFEVLLSVFIKQTSGTIAAPSRATTPAGKASPRRRMSAAARKKISEAMKRSHAARRAADGLRRGGLGTSPTETIKRQTLTIEPIDNVPNGLSLKKSILTFYMSANATRDNPCTKLHCDGTMTWSPTFRSFGPNGGPPYRPAWLCGKCGKHDYISGADEGDVKDWRRKLR